mmetsp:Transcript_3454/g.13173  ORF Transcript_3454/g.13173 Transcript_3454/m.13173 type:complete len:104 (+) Transcript_3454:544-855(+)
MGMRLGANFIRNPHRCVMYNEFSVCIHESQCDIFLDSASCVLDHSSSFLKYLSQTAGILKILSNSLFERSACQSEMGNICSLTGPYKTGTTGCFLLTQSHVNR